MKPASLACMLEFTVGICQPNTKLTAGQFQSNASLACIASPEYTLVITIIWSNGVYKITIIPKQLQSYYWWYT